MALSCTHHTRADAINPFMGLFKLPPHKLKMEEDLERYNVDHHRVALFFLAFPSSAFYIYFFTFLICLYKIKRLG